MNNARTARAILVTRGREAAPRGEIEGSRVPAGDESMSGSTDLILVLGGTGMLGHELVRTLSDDFEVHASVRDRGKARRAGVAGVHHEFQAGEHTIGHLIGSMRP